MIHIYSHGRGAGKSHLRNCFTGPTPKNERRFGLLPVIYGILDQIDDLYAYLNEKRWSAQIFGYPAVIVWFMFLTAAIHLHGFGLYFSY
jgi:hypothetical protein